MSKTSTPKRAKSPQEIKEARNKPFNILLRPVGIAYDIIKYVSLSIIIGIIIEWTGIIIEWWPANHAEQVLRVEFAYLGNNFSTTLFGISAENVAFTVIKFLNSYLRGTGTTETTSAMIVISWIQSLGNWTVAYINAAIYIIMITAIRCVIISLSVTLFIIVGIAAAVDGLHIRELRKLGGDDEHGDVYHYAKSWVPRIIVLSPIIYLAWPSAINPNYILLPGMCLFFVAVFLVFSKYKKVL